MSLETLKLEEIFNSTSLKEVPIEVDELKGEEEVAVVPVVEDEPIIMRRASIPIEEDGTTSTNVSLPIKTRMMNVTETLNRTESRGSFTWLKGGKVSFNLKEEKSSVVGARGDVNKLEDGQLVRQKVGEEMESWEQEGPVSYLRGDIALTSSDGNHEVVLDIEAIHFLSQGEIYGMVTPSFVVSHLLDVPGLPSHRSNRLDRSSKAAGRAVLQEFDRRLVRDRIEFENSGVPAQNPFIQQATGAPCVFVLYGSISSLPLDYSQSSYVEYFSSLYHPTGSSLPPPPAPILKYLLYSENCALVLEGEGEALLSGELWSRATTFGILLGIVQAMMTVLLVRQMEWGASPSNCAKVAYFTIGTQAAMDSYFFITTFTIGVVTNNRASFPLLVPAFFALLSSVFFGTRYTSNIKSATPSAPVRPRPPRPIPPPRPTREQLAAEAAERRANGEEEVVVIPSVVSEGEVPSYFQSPEYDDVKYLIIGFSIGIVCTFIVIFYGWVALFVSILYSYWLPQILHNIQRGVARHSLRREYVIGMTLGRLVMPVYVWACPYNIVGIETSRWIYVLIFYSTAQATILLLQDSRLGSRFFVNRFLLTLLEITEEETWDYHPLPLDLESGGMNEEPFKEDCPICMEAILSPLTKEEKELEEAGGVGGGGMKNQRWKYMVPPCGHLAHTSCMERWLAIKSACPVCRKALASL